MNINFKGNAQIKYLPISDLNRMVDAIRPKEVGIQGFYCFAGRCTSKVPMITRNSNTCSILAVNDTLFHLAPEREEFGLIEKLTDFIKQSADKLGDATAILLGGRVVQCSDISRKLYNNIAEILEKENVDYSMFCGKKFAGMKDDLLKQDNRYFISQKGNLGLENFIKGNNVDSSELLKILRIYYQDVKLSKCHDLIV